MSNSGDSVVIVGSGLGGLVCGYILAKKKTAIALQFSKNTIR